MTCIEFIWMRVGMLNKQRGIIVRQKKSKALQTHEGNRLTLG